MRTIISSTQSEHEDIYDASGERFASVMSCRLLHSWSIVRVWHSTRSRMRSRRWKNRWLDTLIWEATADILGWTHSRCSHENFSSLWFPCTSSNVLSGYSTPMKNRAEAAQHTTVRSRGEDSSTTR